MVDNINFIIIDRNEDTINAFKERFSEYNNFNCVHGDILTVKKADCIVSPANSYGMMDGGVDSTISYTLDYIDKILVRPMINKKYYGEQPIGTCMVIPTNNNRYKYLAHTPTMTLPCNVASTRNTYFAFRALLTEILNHNIKHNDIHTVLMTPFCCGIGRMHPKESSRQTLIAYHLVKNNLKCSWRSAHIVRDLLNEYDNN